MWHLPLNSKSLSIKKATCEYRRVSICIINREKTYMKTKRKVGGNFCSSKPQKHEVIENNNSKTINVK